MSYHNLFERFTITLSDDLPQLVEYTFGVVYNAFISSVLCGVVFRVKRWGFVEGKCVLGGVAVMQCGGEELL